MLERTNSVPYHASDRNINRLHILDNLLNVYDVINIKNVCKFVFSFDGRIKKILNEIALKLDVI